MRFAELVEASGKVAATGSRTAKRDLLAELLGRADIDEVAIVVEFLTGQPRQKRLGMGWRTLSQVLDDVGEPRSGHPLAVSDVDAAFDRLATAGGPGSNLARRAILTELLGRATHEERALLGALIGGELRQGASAGVISDAIAVEADVPSASVRRATMLGGRLGDVAVAALHGGIEALASIGLTVGRPLQPMLASTATSVAAAVAESGPEPCSVEWKLDGIRIQVHRDEDEIRVWSRNLNDITDQVPAVVDAVRSLAVRRVVLDGEALATRSDGRPAAFQDTASGRATDLQRREGGSTGLRPYFFDVLHVEGRDLVDRPHDVRREVLESVAGAWAVPAVRTDDESVAEEMLADALRAGHEGVVVKDVASPYEAGRRGRAWRKVKPVHTLDLVVLAVEWGHGRRAGLLSNLHLGALVDGTAGADDVPRFAMVGKTFKGMTDELLRWQTERFSDLEMDPAAAARLSDDPDLGPGVVAVEPVQVVEVAVDGIQRSTRYASEVALRFARVLRYRDKPVSEADTIATVRALAST